MNDLKYLKSKKILVLMGGFNEEREVSLESGKNVLEALLKAGYNAIPLDFDRDFVSKISKISPDIVFIALHGKFGEDGRVQSILDFLQIPYTHSSYLPSAICMDKSFTSKLVKSFDVDTPKGLVLKKENVDNKQKMSQIDYPIVIKPVDSGSSVGVEIITDIDKFDIDQYEWKYGNKVIVEEYIHGREVQVAVINNRAIGAIETKPENAFYDYESKYISGNTKYIMPANISSENYAKLLKISQEIHRNLGCEGISRVDYIYNEKDDKFYFLEINTHPGFTENSLVPKIAKYCGISFLEIIEYLLHTSKCKL